MRPPGFPMQEGREAHGFLWPLLGKNGSSSGCKNLCASLASQFRKTGECAVSCILGHFAQVVAAEPAGGAGALSVVDGVILPELWLEVPRHSCSCCFSSTYHLCTPSCGSGEITTTAAEKGTRAPTVPDCRASAPPVVSRALAMLCPV